MWNPRRTSPKLVSWMAAGALTLRCTIIVALTGCASDGAGTGRRLSDERPSTGSGRPSEATSNPFADYHSAPELERVIDNEQDAERRVAALHHLEALLLAQITADGAGPRYTLAECPLTDCSSRVTGSFTIGPTEIVQVKGRSYSRDAIQVGPGDSVPVVAGEIQLPAGIGSIHRYNGTVKLSRYTIEGQGDEFHRLTFAVVKGVGYVYLRGIGTIKPAGAAQAVTLGQQRNAQTSQP